MLRVMSVVAATSLCVVALANAQPKFDPNAPAKKVITVGSEIKRGRNAIFSAVSDVPFTSVPLTDFLDRTKAMERVIWKNEQENTDTDGFLLGAQFAAWYQMLIWPKVDSVGASAKAEQITRTYFRSYRRLQNQMGISDAMLCELTGTAYGPLKREIEKYSKLEPPVE